jgi:hypothetical protein
MVTDQLSGMFRYFFIHPRHGSFCQPIKENGQNLLLVETPLYQRIETQFQAAVDDYIETCRELGIETYKSFNGSFNIRISPEAHQKLAWFATKNGKKSTL